MALFDFLKPKDEGKNTSNFVGRHQQVLIVRQILGEDVPALEMQIAINKDLGERNEILEKLQKLEEYMRSDYFTNQFDVLSASKEIGEILDEGYKNCVLCNDIGLEQRCIKIDKGTVEYTKSFAKKNGTLTEESATSLDKILDLRIARGFLLWWTLNNLLTTSDEQHAWMIISSLLNRGKPIGGFDKSHLVSDVLSTLSKKDVGNMAELFRIMNLRLLSEGKISKDEAKLVDEMIANGLTENKKIHEPHPDRP